MSSFSCPNLNQADDWCLLLKTDCVPGRPGCVLRSSSGFAVPAEQRIREKATARKARPLHQRIRQSTD